MSVPVLFVMDPLSAVNPAADSTYVMVTEALRRGHAPFVTELSGLSIEGREPRALAAPVTRPEPGGALLAGERERRPLGDFALVLMRKDPPVDDGYLTATWILERAPKGTLVLNDPQGLRDINEKLGILGFEDLIPRTLVSRDADELRAFMDELGGRMIVKPVFGFGGREILLASAGDPNLGSILELATSEGARWTVAQAYIPQASEGDKRILLLDGEPIGAVLRVPARGELRNNFHTGGRPEASPLDDRDREICAAIGPLLRERGQFFTGIDVIGGQLTEINVTSPTGMQEINRLGGLSGNDTMEALFWAAAEARLGLSGGS